MAIQPARPLHDPAGKPAGHHPNCDSGAPHARGLEFDGVVVVELADFPQNLGRRGSLYTALTRPSRELAVVHTEPLPERLRKR